MRTIAKALQVSRSNLILKAQGPLKRKTTSKKGDEELLKDVQAMIHERHAYGYRRVTVLVKETLKKKGRPCVNKKGFIG